MRTLLGVQSVRTLMSMRIPAIAAVAALLMAAPWSRATEPALVAFGACREGEPNGAYELRMADGRIRVQGAFHDGKRTGTFIFWNADSTRLAIVPYDNDVRSGTIALWHPRGRPVREAQRMLEAPVVAGRAHGVRRSWYASGRLRAEAMFDRGTLIDAKVLTESGRPLPIADARRAALEDARNDEVAIAALERIVARHPPQCQRRDGPSCGNSSIMPCR